MANIRETIEAKVVLELTEQEARALEDILANVAYSDHHEFTGYIRPQLISSIAAIERARMALTRSDAPATGENLPAYPSAHDANSADDLCGTGCGGRAQRVIDSLGQRAKAETVEVHAAPPPPPEVYRSMGFLSDPLRSLSPPGPSPEPLPALAPDGGQSQPPQLTAAPPGSPAGTPPAPPQDHPCSDPPTPAGSSPHERDYTYPVLSASEADTLRRSRGRRKD